MYQFNDSNSKFIFVFNSLSKILKINTYLAHRLDLLGDKSIFFMSITFPAIVMVYDNSVYNIGGTRRQR